jgi:hypothetical protein
MKFAKTVLSSSVLVAAFALSAGTASAGNGIVAAATGSGQINQSGELRTFTFNAVTDGSGVTRGQTQAFTRAGGRSWHGTIDCLSVSGNVATMEGVVTSISPDGPDPFVVGSHIVFQVIDNGEGSNAQPDLISLTFFLGTGPDPGCTGFGVFADTPVEHGNVQVH